jgi:hypothetical protein
MMRKYLLTALGVLTTSTILAQVPAGPNRPGNVPEGYVITPFGYFHSSCVQPIKEGETLRANGTIQHADGSVTGGTTCAHVRFTPDGKPKQADVPNPKTPAVTGWAESAAVVAPTNHSYSAIFDTNKVPANPSNDEGQTLYFFPGLEDINDQSTSILQPVLEYFSHAWTVSNWNCCINGVTTNSTPITTAPGHSIVSTTTENCRAGALSCSTWNILSVDAQTRESTTLSKTPSEGQIFNWAFGAVTEVYNVNTCADFPPAAEIYQTLVFDETFHLTNPKWAVSTNTTATPNCSYGITIKGDDLTLKYSSAATVTPVTVTVTPSAATLTAPPAADIDGNVVTLTVTVSNLSPGSSVAVAWGPSPLLSTTAGTTASVLYAWSVPEGPTVATGNAAGSVVTFTQNGYAHLIMDAVSGATLGTFNIPLTATMTGAPTVTVPLTLIIN